MIGSLTEVENKGLLYLFDAEVIQRAKSILYGSFRTYPWYWNAIIVETEILGDLCSTMVVEMGEGLDLAAASEVAKTEVRKAIRKTGNPFGMADYFLRGMPLVSFDNYDTWTKTGHPSVEDIYEFDREEYEAEQDRKLVLVNKVRAVVGKEHWEIMERRYVRQEGWQQIADEMGLGSRANAYARVNTVRARARKAGLTP